MVKTVEEYREKISGILASLQENDDALEVEN